MESTKARQEMKYVEANGFCFNIDEKMRYGFALAELMNDLKLSKVWLLGKVTGIVKDYFLCQGECNGKTTVFWCSSSTWVFSELPENQCDASTTEKLKNMNNLFTGEFDSVLFQSTGNPKVIDEDLGIVMQPKPVTELDRLAYVVQELRRNFAVPKGSMKCVPQGKTIYNEGFQGLSKDDMLKLENWQFTRDPTDPEILSLIARDEATFNKNCLDSVAKDFPKNAWNIHQDVTGTVATLKSALWPGLVAYHRCNTNISGFFYIGDGIRNANLPFMV